MAAEAATLFQQQINRGDANGVYGGQPCERHGLQ